MGSEDTLSSPPLPSKDEKEAQKVPDHLGKNGTLKATHKWTGFQGKTLWDWLQLLGVLAIPLVVVGATIGFGWWQVHLADLQHQSDQKLAQQQHESDQQRALDQQRAAILQTYIDNIQDLLLNHNLQKSHSYDEVATLARARTLTALQGLDPYRKGVLLHFLYEAHLIAYYDRETGNRLVYWIIDLTNADLSGATLTGAHLMNADLNHADLNGAHLWQADLINADLFSADLTSADLGSAYLIYAHLNGAGLARAIMNGTHLNGAHLINANLSGADLSDADLNGAHLHHTLLSGADLSGADLSGADLSGALVGSDQLAQAKSLKGATMPDGSIHP